MFQNIFANWDKNRKIKKYVYFDKYGIGVYLLTFSGTVYFGWF